MIFSTSQFFFPFSCYHGVPIQCAKYSKAHTSSVQIAPWPWVSRHRSPALDRSHSTSCWSRVAEWLSSWWGIHTRPPTSESAGLYDSGNLEKTLLLFLGVLEKYPPAQRVVRTAQHEPGKESILLTKYALRSARLSLRDNRLFFSKVLTLWLHKVNPR